MRFLIRLAITAAALWVATRIVPGISYSGTALMLVGVAIVFGVLNALLKPVLMILSLPVMILSLGLFTLVLNAFMLWLTSALSGSLGLGFHVAGFIPAFLGALVVSIVSFVLSMLLPD
jgi:putative membrane protein